MMAGSVKLYNSQFVDGEKLDLIRLGLCAPVLLVYLALPSTFLPSTHFENLIWASARFRASARKSAFNELRVKRAAMFEK